MDQLDAGVERIELMLAINRFSDKADALLKTQGTNSSSHVTLQTGSFGLWLCAFCSALTFVMFCVTLVLFVNHDRKIDDLNAYLQVIYLQAPQLKPSDKPN